MAPDYETNDKAGVPLVMELKKNLYGLRQSPKNWFGLCMWRSSSSASVRSSRIRVSHVHLRGREWLFHRNALSGLYSAPHNKTLLNKLKKKLMDRLEMSNAGDVSRVVGMNVTCDREKGAITISHENYRENVVQRYYGRLQPRLHLRSRAEIFSEPTRE